MAALDLLSDSYTRRALVEAVFVGALCGAVGVHVVLRRLSFFAMAMTHATFPGVVLAAILGINLYLGSGVFGFLVVLAVAALSARGDNTSVTGVVLSGSFALGVLLLSAQSGFTRDLTAYLVGSILTVQADDLVTSGIVAAVVLVVLALLSKELVFGAFDRDATVAAGYPAGRLDVVFLLLVEVTIVTSVPAVGTILSVALIVAPAATARLWCDSVRGMTVLSVVIGVASGVIGLAISQQWSVAAGGAIVLTASGIFALSALLAPTIGTPSRRRQARVETRSTVGAVGEEGPLPGPGGAPTRGGTPGPVASGGISS
ncbi:MULTISPECIES: metal ABC transporter permease [Protofrankia]|uniref:ABC-type transporter, integral membrane subunit n=1 Tax=Candidatus Protofrankia datiscae TaxID=2716812 RepID=F8AWB3_9ACTN|nr:MULTISPECIES: metal ABC transporter permease [Protofrankia]AEH11470.1 ABC-type transporter, integral membrane subunit [Candidatus Protofrankia datiscae]